MAPKKWKIKQTDVFIAQLAELSKTTDVAEAFTIGVTVYLERDPHCGCQWGPKIWYLSSMIDVLTIFYTFDDTTVTLHEIVQTLLM